MDDIKVFKIPREELEALYTELLWLEEHLARLDKFTAGAFNTGSPAHKKQMARLAGDFIDMDRYPELSKFVKANRPAAQRPGRVKVALKVGQVWSLAWLYGLVGVNL